MSTDESTYDPPTEAIELRPEFHREDPSQTSELIMSLLKRVSELESEFAELSAAHAKLVQTYVEKEEIIRFPQHPSPVYNLHVPQCEIGFRPLRTKISIKGHSNDESDQQSSEELQNEMDCECGDENEFDNDEKQNNNDESCQEDQYPPDNHSAPPYPESPTEGGLESVDFRFSDDHIRNEEPFFKGYAQTNNYNTTYIPQWRPLEGVNYESSQEEIEISREELQKQRNKIASANYLERLNERMEALETDAREIILSNDHMQFKNQQKLKFMQLAVDSLLPILDDNNQNQIEFDVNAIRQLVHNFEQEKLLIQKTVENNRKEDIEMADKLEEWTNAEEELKKAEYNLENKEEMMPILMIREDTLACRVFRNHRLKNIAFYKYKICCLIHDKEEQRQLSKRLDFHLGFLRPHDRRIHNDLWKDLYHAIEKLPDEEIGAYQYFLYRDTG